MCGAGDTIFALASGAGRAPVAVMRASGAGAGAVMQALCGPLPAARRAVLRPIRGPDGEVLDRALVLWLPGPGSYTGEDGFELHLHGGPAVIAGVSEALVHAGARAAEPGEFTRRAFLNGRMDLLEAEGVADLIVAETEAQRRQALLQADGAQSRVLAEWAGRLRQLLAWQEALIDFADEDLPASVEQGLLAGMEELRAEISAGVAEAARGMRLRDGLVFAVIGRPNVGKSSLVNVLAGRDVAIVSEIPGTTRDVIETRLELDGIPVTLLDTAGLRATGDPLEQEGVRRAEARAAGADLRILVTAGADRSGAGDITIVNKVDVEPAGAGEIGVSARTGEGLAALRARLTAEAVRLAASGGTPALSRARHMAALQQAAACLAEAQDAALPELRGEALRLAMRALSRITGAVDPEAVLDTIFGQFCVGK